MRYSHTTAFLLHLLLILGCNVSAAKSIDECATFYEAAINNPDINSYARLAEYMVQNGKECRKYDEFNLWLGLAYLDAKNYNKSIEVAEDALDSADEYKPNLRHLIAEAELQKGNKQKAINLAKSLEQQFPKYLPIIGFLGEIAIKDKDYEAALHYGLKFYDLEKSARALLTLTNAYHHLGRDEEAVNTYYQALELDSQTLLKTNSLLEVLFSLANQKKWAEANTLAQQHIDANPNWRDSDLFVRAANELRARASAAANLESK